MVRTGGTAHSVAWFMCTCHPYRKRHTNKLKPRGQPEGSTPGCLLLQAKGYTTMAPLSTLVTLAAVAATASAFVVSPSSTQLRTLAGPAGAMASNSNVRSRRRPAAAALPRSLRATADATTYELDEKTLRGPLTPVEDTIMVKVDKPKEVTTGGLFLPKMKSVKITRGTVTAVGEGKRHWDTGVQIPITVSVGERVVYGNFDGTSVEYQGAEHLLMRDNELLMAYEGDEINLDTARMVADRVLLKVQAVPKGSTTMASGVMMAESATRSTRPTVGEVVKVGPGRMVPSGAMIPMHCEVGDRVKYKVSRGWSMMFSSCFHVHGLFRCSRFLDVLGAGRWRSSCVALGHA